VADRRKTTAAFVIPWRDRGQWLWQFLPDSIEGKLLFAAAEPGAGPKRSLPPYIGEFVFLAGRKPAWNQYDIVFTWELRCALAAALLRKVSGGRRGRFVPAGPILKGGILRLLPLIRWLLRDADRIICFSTQECDDYAHLLRLPRERFVFFPTPWLADEEETDREEGYILALGQSNRDYATLIRAVRGTKLPVRIVAGNPSALGGETPPPNVTVVYNTGHDETNELIEGATLHCVPLYDTAFSAGQTVLLRAMARGKAVVVTDTPGVRDYVQNDQTAVLVPPDDANALRTALERLWNDAAERRRIGRQAAKTVREEFGFPRFTARLVELAESLIKEEANHAK
jgi:glycosyltransferase involved in cell wall biosynthesis